MTYLQHPESHKFVSAQQAIFKRQPPDEFACHYKIKPTKKRQQKRKRRRDVQATTKELLEDVEWAKSFEFALQVFGD